PPLAEPPFARGRNSKTAPDAARADRMAIAAAWPRSAPPRGPALRPARRRPLRDEHARARSIERAHAERPLTSRPPAQTDSDPWRRLQWPRARRAPSRNPDAD